MDIHVKRRMLEIAGMSDMVLTESKMDKKKAVKESITDAYQIGSAIEFYLSMFNEMYQDREAASDFDGEAEQVTESSVADYIKDMIDDELAQALEDPEVKRRILEIVGQTQQNIRVPDQGTLDV
jgi:hypothetical protein